MNNQAECKFKILKNEVTNLHYFFIYVCDTYKNPFLQINLLCLEFFL